MGNCLACPPWRRNGKKLEFDPENHITIEATKPEVDEMKEIEPGDNDTLHEIEFGQQTSIENMNCTTFPKTGEMSLEEIKEQKDIDNMTIKRMSDSAKSSKSTPLEDSPSNIQQSLTDEEEGKTTKSGSISMSSKTSTLEDSQKSVGDKNSSQKSDLVKITLEGCENENSKEKDSKDTKGSTPDLTFEEEVYPELEGRLKEAMDEKESVPDSGMISLEIASQENFRSSFHMIPILSDN